MTNDDDVTTLRHKKRTTVHCRRSISRSTQTRFLQKLISSSVPHSNLLQSRPSLTTVLHLTSILVLATATLAVPLAQAVKNDGHAAGGMAITAAAAANAGIPQVLSDGTGGGGVSTRSYHEPRQSNGYGYGHGHGGHNGGHGPLSEKGHGGGGGHGGSTSTRQHTAFDEDGYWREVKAIIGGVLGFWGGVGGLGTLFLVLVLSQRYCCRKDDDKDENEG